MSDVRAPEPGLASMWRVVPALGITQIIGWGSLYYSVAVLAQSMSHSLGMSRTFVFGVFSLSLVTSGLVAPMAGRAIDRFGGRLVLSAGSLCAALALGVVAASSTPVLFTFGWVLAGIAMAMCLYDAAFPALSQLAASRYRSALTALTLFGGLASTAFWPLALYLDSQHGWRVALGSFALLHALVCLPLHLWALAGKRSAKAAPTSATAGRPVPSKGLLWLGLALSANAFVFSAVGAHVVAALGEATGSIETAVWAAALIGPMQVAGRVFEFGFGSRWRAISVGAGALGATVIGMLLLWQAGLAPWLPAAFAVCYGAANGVMTIVRGTVPADLYGRHAYGYLMGKLARPAFFAKAAAPLMVSMFLQVGASYSKVALMLAGVSLLACFGYFMAVTKSGAGKAALPATPAGAEQQDPVPGRT